MAAILIRNLDEQTRYGLRLRAALNRRSLAAEIREILRESARVAPRLAPEPDRQVAPDQEMSLPPLEPVPLLAASETDLIANVNRQLAKMGLSEFAMPENPRR